MPCGAPRRCFRTLGYYGQEGAGRALRAGGKIRLARAFFVLGKVRAQSLCDLRTMLRRRVPRVLTRARAEQVLDNRMHDQLREKLGLGYVRPPPPARLSPSLSLSGRLTPLGVNSPTVIHFRPSLAEV